MSVDTALRSRAIAESSTPVTSPAVVVAASATPVTVTVNDCGSVVRVEAPSVTVVVMVRSMAPLKSVPGVNVTPLSSSAFNVTLPPSGDTVVPSASVRTASSGMPSMVTLTVSEPSMSVDTALRSRAIAVSSMPESVDVCCSPEVVELRSSVGASASGSTETRMVPVWVAKSPSSSVPVAVTVSVKSASESSGGVIFRPWRSSADRVQMPLPGEVSVPAESSAPAGTPAMVTESVSEPSVSTSPAEIWSEIAESSWPDTSVTPSVTPSATPVTSTLTVPVVVAVSPVAVSVEVAVTVRSKSALESAGGVTVRPVNCSGLRV